MDVTSKNKPQKIERETSLHSFEYPNDQIELRELFSSIWTGKWIVLAVTLSFAVGSILYAINQPNIYRAQVLLAPSSSGPSGGLSSVARPFGGLASLAGVSLGGGTEGDKTSLAIEVMKSRKFIVDFIEKYELLVPLMAVKKWNQSENLLEINADIYDVQTGRWVQKTEANAESKPSLWSAHKVFGSVFSIYQAKDTGLIMVNVEHQSPYVAKEWVELLVKEINAVMKQKDVAEAVNSIEYLRKQIEDTQVAEMQKVFYQLIQEQTKTIMLSKVRQEYVFTTVDPAVVPEEKVKPKRASICIVGTLVGGILGLILGLIYGTGSNKRNE